MGSVALEGFGSGGAGLNFKVVGNPQPSNHKENTIWVDTDTKITSWHFASNNPFEHQSEIYIDVGITDNVFINISGELKQDAEAMLTDKISLPDGTTSVTIPADRNNTTTVAHWFYDANGNAISGVLRKTGTVTYTVPDGAKSIRASFIYGDIKSIIANQTVAEEGAVWIVTGTSSAVTFNALKKNGIQAYPISAKQYVDGTWVDVTAKSYQGGEWVDWGTYLYKDGNVNTDLIGSFKAYAYGYSGWSSTKKAPTITHGTNTIDLSLAGVTTGGNSTSQGIVAPENAIDASNFGTLKVHITKYSGEEHGARIGCLSSIRDNFTFVNDTFSIIDGAGDITLDISGISGAVYPIILLSGNGDKSLSFAEWSLEG